MPRSIIIFLGFFFVISSAEAGVKDAHIIYDPGHVQSVHLEPLEGRTTYGELVKRLGRVTGQDLVDDGWSMQVEDYFLLTALKGTEDPDSEILIEVNERGELLLRGSQGELVLGSLVNHNLADALEKCFIFKSSHPCGIEMELRQRYEVFVRTRTHTRMVKEGRQVLPLIVVYYFVPRVFDDSVRLTVIADGQLTSCSGSSLDHKNKLSKYCRELREDKGFSLE